MSAKFTLMDHHNNYQGLNDNVSDDPDYHPNDANEQYLMSSGIQHADNQFVGHEHRVGGGEEDPKI